MANVFSIWPIKHFFDSGHFSRRDFDGLKAMINLKAISSNCNQGATPGQVIDFKEYIYHGGER